MVVALSQPKRGEQPWWAESVDHVFPRRMIRHEVRSTEWLLRNQVFACLRCNNELKRDMHPLKWLSVMPEAGVSRLVPLLVELGVPRRRVDKWHARRSAAAPGSEPDGLPAAI